MNSVIKKTAQMHDAIMMPKIESDIFVFSLNANVRAYDGDVVFVSNGSQSCVQRVHIIEWRKTMKKVK